MSDTFAAIRERYLRFAENEAKGVSPLYAELARGVAADEAVLRFIATLPEPKQQPNLVFAAVRHLYGTPEDAAHFGRLIAAHPEEIRRVVLARRTQTNEPGRCAVLLPVLARIAGPLALLEVGASAGLCLLPDFYGYDYDRARLDPARTGASPSPVFPCRASGNTPIPAGIPEITWRAGLDLNPLDVADPDTAAWLETLVWPGNEARAERLRGAIDLAREHPPALTQGDLLDGLFGVAAQAPLDATLVVFHSAVLSYVPMDVRRRFVEMVRELGAVWISNEFAAVLPDVAAKLDRPAPDDRFLLAVDGEPVAFTGPHGQSIEWIAA